MRRAAILAALATFALAGVTFAGDGKIAWLDNYEQALARARKTGKPLMVKFFTTW